jgi:hypothetical protein
MKVSFKARLFALLLAIITASIIGAATNPSSVHFKKELGFNFASIIIFGFPVYVTFMLLHYWLCKKLNVHSSVPSSIIGAALMLTVWLIVCVAQQEPYEYGLILRSTMAYVAAGAVYGFASGYFGRDTEIA